MILDRSNKQAMRAFENIRTSGDYISLCDMFSDTLIRLRNECCVADAGPGLYRSQGQVALLDEIIDLLNAGDSAPIASGVGISDVAAQG